MKILALSLKFRRYEKKSSIALSVENLSVILESKRYRNSSPINAPAPNPRAHPASTRRRARARARHSNRSGARGRNFFRRSWRYQAIQPTKKKLFLFFFASSVFFASFVVLFAVFVAFVVTLSISSAAATSFTAEIFFLIVGRVFENLSVILESWAL